MLALVLSLAAALPRSIGGLVALRNRDRLHLVMGFAAGALLGVALFGTLPEALDLLGESGVPTPAALAVVLAGAAFLGLLERPALGHVHKEDAACNPAAGHVGAASITFHNFLDGVAVGSAFQAGTELGVIVAGAVLMHAFNDGLNTVAVLLRHGHSRRKALAWLAGDITAPVAGAALALLIAFPQAVLGGILAFFGGVFIYLATGSLLPAAHATRRDTHLVVATTVAAFTLVLALSQVPGV